jgi:hypothetical protein
VHTLRCSLGFQPSSLSSAKSLSFSSSFSFSVIDRCLKTGLRCVKERERTDELLAFARAKETENENDDENEDD